MWQLLVSLGFWCRYTKVALYLRLDEWLHYSLTSPIVACCEHRTSYVLAFQHAEAAQAMPRIVAAHMQPLQRPRIRRSAESLALVAIWSAGGPRWQGLIRAGRHHPAKCASQRRLKQSVSPESVDEVEVTSSAEVMIRVRCCMPRLSLAHLETATLVSCMLAFSRGLSAHCSR